MQEEEEELLQKFRAAKEAESAAKEAARDAKEEEVTWPADLTGYG